ncbi:Lpg1974 family pore-forming outer membrane protein [Fluoribacter dumoffii]|uniref:Lpg1974 family pore-forming outer membrane protein n=1 Tax=Fluoribacter dumoffii TaxID=463 RepID=UPI002244F42C|nr:Lpg1974 family pore-forming outer membrane protein [Fluoribacter dumoffii]MCW8387347.1 Lpg1974 family pore-forming outer membrane protein [Fluoribacter dumoffii]MCW8417146.1 Lpg1974 family pore-forming outer membrane protein [Fluoribacter dumoffii]MCW8455014.1 Lpg1974 family pore-forming outer membrane protein [Fluoribacter dumoffii]MCW8460909.1 Lpg1974 family pore-forming outer membrane protein [Fluoribacter dumoffii]MCW8484351.1 Lpg1974 family pore-forming outer membrane protein [Fluoriba
MLNLKKTAVAVLALGSSAVFAGTMGPVCTPGNVTVPCPSTGWNIGGQALVLQTMTDNDVTLDLDFTPAGVSIDTELDAQWNWGFQIEGSYHFNTGNDVTLTWYHLDTGWNNHEFTPAIDPDTLIGFGHKNRWDAVNGEMGQFVDFSANKKIRFHGGFQFASIKRSMHAFATDFDAGVPDFTVGFEGNTQYNGFGPRTGIDMNYVFGNGFGVYAKAAAAVLVGSQKHGYDVDFVDADGSVPVLPTTFTVNVSGSRTAIVPELEAKLGANYTYAMAQGDLTLDAGYMWFDYIHALNTTVLPVTSTDFAAAGPYFGLKYVGNI